MLNTGVSLQRIAVKGKTGPYVPPPFTPQALFNNSEYGAWWTAQDFNPNLSNNLIDHNSTLNGVNVLITKTGGQADPDGGTNAQLLKQTATNGQHFLFMQPSSVNWRQQSGYQTFSGYFKAKELNGFALGLTFHGVSDLKYLFVQDLGGTPSINTAATNSSHSNFESYSITSVGNGWHKLVATYLQQSTGAYVMTFTTSGSGSSQSLDYAAPNATDGFYAYGYQFEHGQTATTLELLSAIVLNHRRAITTKYKNSSNQSLTAYGDLLVNWHSKSNSLVLGQSQGNCPRIALYPERGKINVFNGNRGTAPFTLGTNYTTDFTPLVDVLGNFDATAESFSANAVGTRVAYKEMSIAGGATYTASIYLKNASSTGFKIRLGGGNDPDAAEFTESTVVNVDATGNTWQRFTVSHTFSTSRSTIDFRIETTNTASSKTIEKCLLQIEEGSSATTVQQVSGPYEVRENNSGFKQVAFDGTSGYDTALALQTNSVDELLIGFGCKSTEEISSSDDMLCEFTDYHYGAGTFNLRRISNSRFKSRFVYSGAAVGGSTTGNNTFPANAHRTCIAHANGDTGVTKTKFNGTEITSTVTAPASSFLFANEDWSVGCRNADMPQQEWVGGIMEVVIRGGATSDAERNNLHDYIDGKI
tara:strand:+ start:6012 stop:7943 length:1932 start_codon:yes stop_codon:yes gene_type:complete